MKEGTRNIAVESLANDEPFSKNTSIKELIKIDGNSASYSINGIKANARIRWSTDEETQFQNTLFAKWWGALINSNDSSITKWTKAAPSSKMDYCFERNTEKVVVAKTSKWSFRKISLLRCYGPCTENLESSTQSTKQYLHTDKITVARTRHSWWESGSCHKKNVSRNP